jgi:hypothetical protein
MLVSPTVAGTIAETARQWGLIGPWSLDCSRPPDHAKGAVLSYEIEGDRLTYWREFGDSNDEAEVLSAVVSGDGILDLKAYFPVGEADARIRFDAPAGRQRSRGL